MAIKLDDMLETFRFANEQSLSNYSFVLATHPDKDSLSVELRPFGNFMCVDDDQRVVAVTESQCAFFNNLKELPASEVEARVNELSTLVGRCPVEVLNDVFFLEDGSRVLDYGGHAIEQVLWHKDRGEFWLLESFVVAEGTIHPPLYKVVGE